MSFKDMKKNSAGNVQSLSKQLEQLDKKGNFAKDERIWSVERDKTGNGYAVIRFLPAPENEDMMWVQMFSHNFKVNGKWYIENCPTTLGGKCPCCEANSQLWNSGLASDKEIARNRKRKLNYYSNVLVISDPAHKENEGQIKLFRYGKKIMDKIKDCMNPNPASKRDKVNPFDFWAGKNFELNVCTIADFPNFDKSEFASATPLLNGDDVALENLWKKQFPLKPLADPKLFKSYEELQARLNEVLKSGGSASNVSNISKPASTPFSGRPATQPSASAPAVAVEEDDQTNFFNKLMQDDE